MMQMGMRRVLGGFLVLFLATSLPFGLHVAAEPQTLLFDNGVQLEVVATNSVPLFGTFWSLQKSEPPIPFRFLPELDLPIYQLSDGQFLIDDRQVNYPELLAEQTMNAGLASGGFSTSSAAPSPPGGGGGGSGGGGGGVPTPPPPYVYPNDTFYVEIVGFSASVVNIVIHGTVPDTAYALLRKLSLSEAAWSLEQQIVGAPGQSWTSASVSLSGRPNLFLQAQSWDGVGGVVLPDPWQIQYFGHTGVDPYADSDGDGWLNWQEYLRNTNPLSPDSAPPVVTVTVSAPTVPEAGGTTASFMISRTGPTTAALKIYLSAETAQNAVPGIDYEALPSNVTIVAGQTTASVLFRPIDDLEPEENETVSLGASENLNYAQGNPASASITILDNDLTVAVVASDSQAAEPGNGSAADPGTFTISRQGDTDSALAVAFTFLSGAGMAANGSDFQTISTTATIPAGEQTVDVTVMPLADGIYEGTEQVVLVLQNSANYHNDPAHSQATVFIKDADLPVISVTASSGLFSEGSGGSPQFTFQRSAPANGGVIDPLVVLYRVHGSALAGSDYVTPSGSIVIPANATSVTLPITLIDDSEPEPVETLKLTIAGSLGYKIGLQNTATLLIDDNEPTSYAIKIIKPSIFYNTSPHVDWKGQFVISRTGSAAASASVSYTTQYMLTGGGVSGLTTFVATFAPQQSDYYPPEWQHTSTAQEYLRVTLLNVPNPPSARMPCLNPDKIVSMDLVPSSSSINIQEGNDVATLHINAPSGTFVRLQFSGSAVPSDFVNYQTLFDRLDGRWLLDLPIPAGQNWAEVSLTAVNDQIPESVEYVVVRFDTT